MRDITGIRFGQVTILEFSHKDAKNYFWHGKCDCGNQKLFRASNLKDNGTYSCGCYVGNQGGSHPKHGGWGTSEYRSWQAMKARCLNPKISEYKYYGAKGVKVCDRWLNSFENFLADMGKKPIGKNTIDRIDPRGNYEPSNCRWLSLPDQLRNKRDTVWVEGVCLSDFCRRKGLPYNTIRRRIRTEHWDIQRAISTPVRIKRVSYGR
jgi:hypothetical protein